MRVIDLHTGDTVQAANDEDLYKLVRERIPEEELSDEEVRRLIEERAYSAMDG
jgi:hypothetical protein